MLKNKGWDALLILASLASLGMDLSAISLPIELKLGLLPLAAWRLYRLIALDTGPKECFRRLRLKAGVKYVQKPNGETDWSSWKTEDGSLAEMIVCIKCLSLWIGIAFTAIWLLAPDWLYITIMLPLNISAVVMIFENVFYAPRVKN